LPLDGCLFPEAYRTPPTAKLHILRKYVGAGARVHLINFNSKKFLDYSGK